MHSKGNIERYLLRVYYHFKCLRWLSVVPVLLLCVVLPVLAVLSVKGEGVTQQAEEKIREAVGILVPFFAGWWPVLILREYIEADGNELLFIYGRRIKYGDTAAFLIIYLLLLCIFFLGILAVFPGMAFFCVWIIIACLFIFHLVYFLSFLSKSTTITLMSSLLYAFANIIFTPDAAVPFLYVSAQAYPGAALSTEFLVVYLPMILFSILFAAVGMLLNQRKIKMN